MIDLEKAEYFEPVERLSNILMQKTQTTDPLFFRIMVSYYLTKVASMMRCNIQTIDRGPIPVNMYALNLALSGHGKGHSTNIVEEQVIHKFKERFLADTFNKIADQTLYKLANKRSTAKVSDFDEEHERVKAEFANLGPLMFSFDSGTTPAVKQMRHKLLMAGAGSMNMEIDEIGSNLIGQTEVLNSFLELFDVGKIKQKLIKSTKENMRNEDIDGRTPTNMLLFGTPAKLLNGGKEEQEFYSMLETGYARRCIFGYTKNLTKDIGKSAQEIFDLMTDKSSDAYIKKLAHKLMKLADPVNFNVNLQVPKSTTMELIEYQIQCDHQAAEMADHQEVQKAEITHRYFKALKLAGTYAFIDGSTDIKISHLAAAIKLVEDSGEAFSHILTRDKAHVKLAKYIADVGREVTHPDIQEDLPCYNKSSMAERKAMLDYAIAWGYKNNIIIKKTYDNDIEFLTGESLAETDMDKMYASISTDVAVGYNTQVFPFDQINILTQAQGYHFINHKLSEPRRNEENCLPGFNMAVIDVDDGISIDTAKLLLEDYKYHLYTTKSHTPDNHRFRIIFPLSHEVKLDAKDYKQFMINLYDFLPFDVDRVTNQRARKWLSHKGTYYDHDGDVLDALMFIPKTKKSEERAKTLGRLNNLSAVERWFIKSTDTGNRSNNLVRYGLMLVDSGLKLDDITDKVLAFNKKLPDSLDEAEVFSTILRTVGKAVSKRDTANAN